MNKPSWMSWGKPLASAQKLADGLRAKERKQVLEQATHLADSKRTEESLALLQAYFDRHGDAVVGRRLAVQLLKAGQFKALTDRPGLQALSSREFSLAAHLAGMDLEDVSPVLTQGLPPRPDLAYVGMVKNEEDIILFNLVWHYALGVRRFFLMDNGSTDQTGPLVCLFEQRFADAVVYRLHDPVVAYLQGQKMTAACAFVEQIWPDVAWLLLVDADEFLCLHRPWDEVLADAGPAQALVMPKSVYGLTEGDDALESAHFSERLLSRKLPFQVSNKVLVRAGRGGLAVGAGNHRLVESAADAPPVAYASPRGLTMREYPVRSEAQFLGKIVNGGRALEAAAQLGAAPIGTHWSAWYKQVCQRGVAGLRSVMRTHLEQHAAAALLRDPLPVTAVMDHLMPDWRETLDPLLAQRRRAHQALIDAGLSPEALLAPRA
ncbi:glycosyltransferase family 2 protein [Ideonella livida]|uniref:Glycosyltransferase family 2 protein n=1 Tax=Ideonella livida TaxID=2707176 RepID=A0A7C9PGL7_9BURK|nr:glycosyltransferase family 2 protein [Ideonella livida]NDY91011.1 glycosyltransferase family 2 protein [Ideonella livida]